MNFQQLCEFSKQLLEVIMSTILKFLFNLFSGLPLYRINLESMKSPGIQ